MKRRCLLDIGPNDRDANRRAIYAIWPARRDILSYRQVHIALVFRNIADLNNDVLMNQRKGGSGSLLIDDEIAGLTITRGRVDRDPPRVALTNWDVDQRRKQ